LELARCHDFPNGNSDRGYELTLPLTNEGRLDAEGWLQHRDECRFRRFWNGQENGGAVKHDRGGWRLVFENHLEDDEVIFRGDHHRFAPGEYISVNEPDGTMRTFCVAQIG
jgi:hypothetical protein